jgi:hypothetical protein
MYSCTMSCTQRGRTRALDLLCMGQRSPNRYQKYSTFQVLQIYANEPKIHYRTSVILNFWCSYGNLKITSLYGNCMKSGCIYMALSYMQSCSLRTHCWSREAQPPPSDPNRALWSPSSAPAALCGHKRAPRARSQGLPARGASSSHARATAMATGTPPMISPPQTAPALVYGLSPKASRAAITTEDEVCRLAGLICKRPCSAAMIQKAPQETNTAVRARGRHIF